MIEILSNYFRSVIVLSPEDLIPSVYLCLNKIGPAYEGEFCNQYTLFTSEDSLSLKIPVTVRIGVGHSRNESYESHRTVHRSDPGADKNRCTNDG